MMNLLLAQGGPPPGPPLQPLPHPNLPEVFLPPAPTPAWIYITGAAVLVFLLALVLWLLLRPRGATPPPLKRPWAIAMKALKDIAAKASEQTPGVTSAQVSEVLRRYFLERYDIPAPFRTTREIFEGDGIPATSLKLHKYAPLAELWDELSFAPLPTTNVEAAALVDKAIAHLEEDRL